MLLAPRKSVFGAQAASAAAPATATVPAMKARRERYRCSGVISDEGISIPVCFLMSMIDQLLAAFTTCAVRLDLGAS